MVICLLQGANDLHMDQLTPLPSHHLLLLVSDIAISVLKRDVKLQLTN